MYSCFLCCYVYRDKTVEDGSSIEHARVFSAATILVSVHRNTTVILGQVIYVRKLCILKIKLISKEITMSALRYEYHRRYY